MAAFRGGAVQIDGDFKDANKAAGKALRRAKSHREGAVAEAHMPYVAFCASCGVGLAERTASLAEEADAVRARYLCLACQTKAVRELMNSGRSWVSSYAEMVGKRQDPPKPLNGPRMPMK